MIESELKFLVAQVPDLGPLEHEPIDQHYLSEPPQSLRIRRIGGRCEITKKFALAAGDRTTKEELTIPLRADEYDRLRPLALRSLQKTRYYIPLPGGLTAELDVFHGPLAGLVLVEVEFPDDAAQAGFTPPAWFGRGVSQERWSSNSKLAGKTFAELLPFVRH